MYNGERYVAQSIESLLSQTFEDFRILISDNASTDGTGDICRRYALADSRITYHRNARNIGMAGNYNLVFDGCRSLYFRWATADDYWAPGMLAAAVAVLESHPDLALCYPLAVYVDGDGRELRRWKDDLHLLQDDPVDRFWAVLMGIGGVLHHLGLMRTDMVARTRLLSQHLASDVVFVSEMSLYGKFFQVPEYHFFRRMHEDSSSWDTTSEEHQARRYHAANVDRIPFNRLRLHGRLFESVARSPLSEIDKARAYKRLFRRAVWDREELARELRREIRLAAGFDTA